MDTLHSLSLKQLQYFAAVAEYGSFRQAAFRLNITQPTLSNQIAAMEKIIKNQLFERSRRGITLTAQGRELLASARRVLDEAQGFTTLAAVLSGGRNGNLSAWGSPYARALSVAPYPQSHSRKLQRTETLCAGGYALQS